MSKEKYLRITLVRSAIGRDYTQKDTVRSLGLRKLNKTVTVRDTPQVRGMVRKVQHLVQVEEIEQ
jgi:large subunit ribosomal protein L30